MARSAWVAGNLNSSLNWVPLFNSADLASLATGSGVLSSVTAFINGTALDQFMDVSLRLAISSNTIAAGSSVALYLMALLDDGATYGDGSFAGTGAGNTIATPPTVFPIATFNFRAVASTTILAGQALLLTIPPGTWLPALVNNSGFALTSGTQVCKFRSYNQNLSN